MTNIGCAHCDHPLAPETSNVCPECGRSFDRSDPESFIELQDGRPAGRMDLRSAAFVPGPLLIGFAPFASLGVLHGVGWDGSMLAALLGILCLAAGVGLCLVPAIRFGRANARTPVHQMGLVAVLMFGALVLAGFFFGLVTVLPLTPPLRP